MNQVQVLSDSLPPQKKQGYRAGGLQLAHKARVDSEIRTLGAGRYNFWLPETRVLPLVIHPDEHITGIVYGRYVLSSNAQVGRGALVATDTRIVLIDKKFLFLRCDEISYDAVSGVTYSRVGFIGTIVLHTRLGDITLRTLNRNCTKSFVESIEKNISKPAT